MTDLWSTIQVGVIYNEIKLVIHNIDKYEHISKKRSEISTKNTLAVKRSCGQELKKGYVEKDVKSKNGRPRAAQW